ENDIPTVRKISWELWGWSLTPSCYGTLFICRQLWIISGRRVKH
ncbi:transposase for transposon Tn3, partial [Klebsiella pneumoniae]